MTARDVPTSAATPRPKRRRGSGPRGWAGADRPRVLFLTGHLPYPPISGGRLREYELLTRLADRFRFHVLALSKTPEEDVANASKLRLAGGTVEVFPAHPDDAPPGLCELEARHWSAEATRRAGILLASGEIDLVHVEGFHLMRHLPERPGMPVLLVEQNVEYALWHQRVRSASGRERRRRLVQYGLTLQAEIDAWRRADVCAAVTEDDRETMRAALPGVDVRLVGNGTDHTALVAEADRMLTGLELLPGRTLVYVGNFGYAPNVDAARYLCRRILPLIRTRVPDVTLLLVGNAPPREVRELASDGVIVTGRVPSVVPYLRAADVVVAPLRVGGGIKVKVLEALTQGRAVVTSSVGAQGLGRTARRALVVADRPGSFARAVVRLLLDAGARARLETAAAAAAAELPSWDDGAAALEACYRELATRAAVAT